MKRFILIIIMLNVLTLSGCNFGNKSFIDETFVVGYDGYYDTLSEDELTLIDQGGFSDYFILTNEQDLTDWKEAHLNSSIEFDKISKNKVYDDVYFENNTLIIVLVTDRAYSVDFQLVNLIIEDGNVNIEIGYHIPSNAFGDSYSDIRGMIIEIPEPNATETSVQVTYVDR